MLFLVKKNERKILKKLASWNVNGIRAVNRNGLEDWLNAVSPDIACLQEIKSEKKFFPENLLQLKDYAVAINPAKRPGYSGTATFYKKDFAPKNIRFGLDLPLFDDEGRTLIFEYDDFVLFNCYFPNGQRDHNRVPYKLEYCRALHLEAQKYLLQEKHVIICGDYNTAHHEMDLANPKTNLNTTGFLPIERDWMDEFTHSGFTDCFRGLNPEKKDEYTWWTYRNDCRGRNIGWRIDYFFTNDEFFHSEVKNCYHMPEQLGSDHCPLILEI